MDKRTKGVIKMKQDYIFDKVFYALPAEKIFEDEMFTVIGDHFSRMENGTISSEFRWAVQDADRKSGINAFIYGLPCTFTTFPNDFDSAHTRRVGELDLNEGVKVRFGVKLGNGRVKYGVPILVIGVDTGHMGTQYVSKMTIDRIIRKIRTNLAQVIEVGQSAYWAYLDRINAWQADMNSLATEQ